MSAQDDAVRIEKGANLPPIHHIKEQGDMKVMSTRIRWYSELGYKVGEISNFLGVRYQQVRNVINTLPKRAAREDLPALVIELLELDNDLEAMDKRAMEMEMAQQRNQDRKFKHEANKERLSKRETEDLLNNADLDNEDYGRTE
jgi:hypothetical protein